MVVSSRTPEGSPGRCPVCGDCVRVEPSRPFGDAPCPRCGSLLWFRAGRSGHLFYAGGEADVAREQLLDLVAANLGVNREGLRADPAALAALGADSLDLAELLLELEEEFG